MSRRSERIRQLVELAQRRAEQAARQLGQHDARLQQARSTREDLDKFRHLYGEQSTRPGQVITAATLRNSQQFLGRIDQALQQQHTELQRQQQQSERLRQQWLQARQRASALDLVARQMEQGEQQQRQQSEQELADEMSALRFNLSRRR